MEVQPNRSKPHQQLRSSLLQLYADLRRRTVQPGIEEQPLAGDAPEEQSSKNTDEESAGAIAFEIGI